jgi:microcystin-dependent protein
MAELTRMQQRRGTAQQWTTNNPILAAGEIGFEFDTKKFKIGNGQLEWNDLEYFVSIDQILGDLPPETLDTIKELAEAINNDPDFLDNVLSKSGGTMTGPLILADDPEEELEAATKSYVDEQDQATLSSAEDYADGLTYTVQDLTNVDVSGAVSGDTLIFNTITQTWVADAPGIGLINLDDLADVDISGVSTGDTLVYNSTLDEWVADTPGVGVLELNDLADVDVSSPEVGDVLSYDTTTSTWTGQPVSIIIPDQVPAGALMPYAASTAPSGWLIANGSAVSRSTYAALFSAIGTTYGVGDGETTFNIPNLQGRVIAGQDTSQTEFDSLGKTGGEKAHALTVEEMPSHTHTQNSHNHSGSTGSAGTHGHNSSTGSAGSHTHSYNSPGSGTRASGTTGTITFAQSNTTGSNGSHTHSLSIETNGSHTHSVSVGSTTATNNNTGGGVEHNNLQPFLTLQYIIKT